jgi:uncharacterized spore protein YtfJ
MTTNYAATTEEMVRRIGTISEDVGAGVCFGSPVERDGHTIIPVARVSFGYGMGFGGGSGSKGVPSEFGTGHAEGGEGGGGGGGGRGTSDPVAVIDVSQGEVQVTPITDSTRIALTSFLFAGWAAFWLFLTIRTVARETAKTRRLQIEKTKS